MKKKVAPTAGSTTKPDEPRPPIKVSSLADLQKFCEQSILVEFNFLTQTFQVEARKLTPKEDATLDEIMNTILPPVVRGEKPELDRINYHDANFVKLKSAVDIKARALGIYWCVPIFQKEKPGLTKQEDILDFVQSKFNAMILDVLWQAIRNGGVTMATLVNFTSSSTSPAS